MTSGSASQRGTLRELPRRSLTEGNGMHPSVATKCPRGSGEYAGTVRALILGSSSAGPLKEMLDRRHSWGADRHDEVWRGVLHLDLLRTHADLAQQLGELLSPQARTAGMTVAMGECNFGEAEHDAHELDGALRLTSAQLVVEIVTPDQDSWEKLSFYAVHHINEVVIVDPAERAVHWLMLAEPGGYQAVERSGLIDLDPFKLADQLEEQENKPS